MSSEAFCGSLPKQRFKCLPHETNHRSTTTVYVITCKCIEKKKKHCCKVGGSDGNEKIAKSCLFGFSWSLTYSKPVPGAAYAAVNFGFVLSDYSMARSWCARSLSPPPGMHKPWSKKESLGVLVKENVLDANRLNIITLF